MKISEPSIDELKARLNEAVRKAEVAKLKEKEKKAVAKKEPRVKVGKPFPRERGW